MKNFTFYDLLSQYASILERYRHEVNGGHLILTDGVKWADLKTVSIPHLTANNVQIVSFPGMWRLGYPDLFKRMQKEPYFDEVSFYCCLIALSEFDFEKAYYYFTENFPEETVDVDQRFILDVANSINLNKPSSWNINLNESAIYYRTLVSQLMDLILATNPIVHECGAPLN